LANKLKQKQNFFTEDEKLKQKKRRKKDEGERKRVRENGAKK